MDKKQEKAIISNYRKEVYEVLELIASKEEQLDYQEKVPIAYVSAELFNQWEDCYQIPKEQSWYKKAFSSAELSIFSEFNETLEIVCEKTSINPPDIAEFINTPEWHELSKAAQRALKKLNDYKSNN